MQEEVKDLTAEILKESVSAAENNDSPKRNNLASNEVTGWEVYKFLSKIPFEKIAFVFMIVIVLQPLVGIFWQITDLQQYSYYCHFKANLIRVPGCIFVVFSLLSNFKNRALFGKEYTRRTYLKSPWVLLLTVVVIMGYISCFYSGNPLKSLKGHGYLWQGFVGFLSYAGIFGAASLISDSKQKHFLFDLHVAASSLLAIVTFLSAEFGMRSILLERSTFINVYSGTFINQNPYGYYLCVSLMVCAGFLACEKKLSKSLFYAAGLVFNLVVLVRNKSLGPYLAFFAGLILLVILCVIRSGKKALPRLAVILVLVLVVSFVSSDGALKNDIKRMLSEGHTLSGEILEGLVTGDMESAISDVNAGSRRIELWKITIQAISDRPLLGMGLDTTSNYIGKYRSPATTPHNEYLEIAAELGIPAALMYVAALVLLFVASVKHLKELPEVIIVAGCVVAAYAFSALFAFSMPTANCFMFMALGLTNSWHKNKDYVELLKKQIDASE